MAQASDAVLSVVLADDHALVRAGLKALLVEMKAVRVVGEASDGAEALRLVVSLRPDIVVTDIAMPGLGGLALLGEVRKLNPAARVILLSMHENDAYVSEAIRLGAAGYIVKSAAAEELSLAIGAVSRGDVYLSPRIVSKLTQAYVGGQAPLTERQIDVLRLIAGGRSSKEIARALNLSIKTVETHRSQIMDRLGIRDLAGLVRYAVRSGIVDPGE